MAEAVLTTVMPAVELGLLVQVAVHQHRLPRAFTGGAGRGHFKEHDRRATGQLDDLEREAFHLLRLDPLGGAAQHRFDVAMRGPVGVKSGGLGGNLDVVFQLGHDGAVPSLGDVVHPRF